MKEKRKAPTKACPDCQEECHARLSSCKKCGFVFYKKKKRFIEDYYIKENGERVYFTDAGIYIVKRVVKDGLLVMGHGRKAHGFGFLYMGNEKKSRLVDSVYNSPHKLAVVSLKRKEKESLR